MTICVENTQNKIYEFYVQSINFVVVYKDAWWVFSYGQEKLP